MIQTGGVGLRMALAFSQLGVDVEGQVPFSITMESDPQSFLHLRKLVAYLCMIDLEEINLHSPWCPFMQYKSFLEFKIYYS